MHPWIARLRTVRAPDVALFLLVAVGTGLLSMRPVSDVDIHWHLALGRYIALHHALPATNLWSYTAPEHPFLCSSWLYDLAMHLFQRTGGLVAVQVVNAVTVGLTFGCCFALARLRGAGRATAATVVLILGLGAIASLAPRPHRFTELFLALTSLSLLGLERRWSWTLALLVPGGIAVWANLHAGVVFGPVLVGSWALGWLWSRRDESEAMLRAAALVALSGLCVLATPHGVGLIRYAAFHIKDVDQLVPLGEFDVPALGTESIFWIAVVLSLAAWPWARRRVPLSAALPATVFFFLALGAVRLILQFMVVLGPVLAVELTALWERSPRLVRVMRPGWVRAAAATVAVFLASFLPIPHSPALMLSRFKLGRDPWRVPLPAASWVRQQGIQGRCFAGWDVSGLVEWALPESPVQIDPRLLAYPPELFHQLLEAESSQETFDAFVARYDIEWGFRSHRALNLVGLDRFRPDRWALVYWDESGMVFLRRDVPRFHALIDAFEYRAFLPSSLSSEAAATALDGDRHGRWMAELGRLEREAPALIDVHTARCVESIRDHALDAARDHCRRATRLAEERGRVHWPLSEPELGTAWVLVGRAELDAGASGAADDSIRQALHVAPDDAAVRSAVGSVFLRREPARAARYFHEALELEPGYAPALEGLRRLSLPRGRLDVLRPSRRTQRL